MRSPTQRNAAHHSDAAFETRRDELIITNAAPNFLNMQPILSKRIRISAKGVDMLVDAPSFLLRLAARISARPDGADTLI